MPIPPDYGETPKKEPNSFRFRLPDDWVFLLVVGVACVGISGGDLNNLGQQLTGASLAAFRIVVSGRVKRNSEPD